MPQEIAEMIGGFMERHGTTVIRGCVPTRFTRTEAGRVACTYKNMDLGFENTEEYDTVVLAGESHATKL
jgi:hypothetical protein